MEKLRFEIAMNLVRKLKISNSDAMSLVGLDETQPKAKRRYRRSKPGPKPAAQKRIRKTKKSKE